VRVRDDESGARTLAALRALGAERGAPPGLTVPPGTQRLSLTVDSEVTPVDGFDPVPAGNDGLSMSALLLDADGRLVRLPGTTAELGASGQRLEVPLTGPDGAALPMPATIAAVALEVTTGRAGTVVADGHVDVTGLDASTEAAGDSWTPLDLQGGRTILTVDGQRAQDTDASGTLPERIPVTSLFATQRLEWQRSLAPANPAPAPILVNAAFLDRTGAAVGDTLRASAFGVPLDVVITGAVEGFPTLDGSKPFALIDGMALDLVRLDAGVAAADTNEWWISTPDGPAVASAVAAAPIGAATVVDRSTVESSLTGDPVGLGVIGILGLGSIAALVFAAIGFLVTVTVGTTERLGELALLKALGLGPRSLLSWLSAESVALLVVGLAAGVALGLILAWVALPFATLTASGAPPVPPPAVVVPPEALLPTLALGLILVVATVLLVRRQLPAARTSSVLRARDE